MIKLVEGFNIGSNSGKVAGQSINHCHIHLIPRREGDVKNPQGGVRGVIPSNNIMSVNQIKSRPISTVECQYNAVDLLL